MSDMYSPSPSLATDAIVLRKHKDDIKHDILMVTRAHYPFQGCLAFPGGFVNYNEDPLQGCLRELKEETNLEGRNIELFTVVGNPKRDPRHHVCSIIYLVQVPPESVPIGGDDAVKAEYYPLENILKENHKIAFDHYEIITDLVNKKFNDIYKL